MNFGPLFQSPDATGTASNRVDVVEESCAQLLELRTGAGLVYVCPSRWQRIRLLWTFRHFRVLSSRVLGRRDRLLIENLLQTAVVTPPRPSTNAVFGVVEHVEQKSSADRMSGMEIEPANTKVSSGKKEISVFPDLDLSNAERRFVERFYLGYLARMSGSIPFEARVGMSQGATEDTADSGKEQNKWRARNARLQQRVTLGVLGAVCFAAIFARLSRISLLPSSPQTPLASKQQATHDVKPEPASVPSPIRAPLATTSLPGVAKAKHAVTPLSPGQLSVSENSVSVSDRLEPSASTSGPVKTISPATAGSDLSGSSERFVISQLPQDHFVHPTVSDPSLTGELLLKAWIGTDGSVKDVTVLSGSPQLAQAGIRAVRQWRYAPDQASDGPSEVETNIKMKFFGEDTVSITALAKGPGSAIK